MSERSPNERAALAELDVQQRGITGLKPGMFDIAGVAQHVTYDTWRILPKEIRQNGTVAIALLHRHPCRTKLVLDSMPEATKQELLMHRWVRDIYESRLDNAAEIYATRSEDRPCAHQLSDPATTRVHVNGSLHEAPAVAAPIITH